LRTGPQIQFDPEPTVRHSAPGGAYDFIVSIVDERTYIYPWHRGWTDTHTIWMAIEVHSMASRVALKRLSNGLLDTLAEKGTLSDILPFGAPDFFALDGKRIVAPRANVVISQAADVLAIPARHGVREDFELSSR
jgi:hypothetical protein